MRLITTLLVTACSSVSTLTFASQAPLPTKCNFVSSIEFSPNLERVIEVVNTGLNSSVREWTTKSGTLLKTVEMEPHQGFYSLDKVTYDFTGHFVFGALANWGVTYADLSSGSRLSSYAPDSVDATPETMVSSEDGQFLATAYSSEHHDVEVYDLHAVHRIFNLPGSYSQVPRQLVFLNGHERLAVLGSPSGIYSVEDGARLGSIDGSAITRAPNGQLAVLAGSRLSLIDPHTLREVQHYTLQTYGTQIQFDPSMHHVLVSRVSDSNVAWVELASGRVLLNVSLKGGIGRVSTDGRRFGIAGDHGAVSIYDAAHAHLLFQMCSPHDPHAMQYEAPFPQH